MKYLLLSSLCSLAVASSNQLDIRPTKLLVPGSLDGLKLSHNQGQFSVHHEGECKLVQNYNVDKEIRAVDAAKLKALLKQGYIAVNQSTNGDYKLQYNARIRGGGGVAGYWAYCITKALCYGIGVAAVGGVTVASGGAAGAVVGAASTAAVSGASVGAGIAAGAIAGAGATGTAATVTAGAVAASGGSVAVLTGTIESVSLFMGSVFTLLPIP